MGEQSKEVAIKVDMANLPNSADVLLEHSWTGDAAKLLKLRELNELPSFDEEDEEFELKVLRELGSHCRDAGLNDSEIYSMLLNYSRRWEIELDDEKHDIIQVIAMVRSAPNSGIEFGKSFADFNGGAQTKVLNWRELLESDFTVEWILENLLMQSGVIAFAGPPGGGKTQLMADFCVSLTTNAPFMGYEVVVGRPLKILFISLEMGGGEIKYFIEQKDRGMTSEQRKLLEENFLFFAHGEQLYLNNDTDRAKYFQLIRDYEPDGVIIDSWSMAVFGDLSSDSVTREAFGFINAMRKYFGCFFGIINHTKKKQGESKPNTMDDMFGSRFFSAQLSTGIVVWPRDNDDEEIELHVVKSRFSRKPHKPMVIRRTENLGFELTSEHPKNMLSKAERKRELKDLEHQGLAELLKRGGGFRPIKPLKDQAPEYFDTSIIEDIPKDKGPISGLQL